MAGRDSSYYSAGYSYAHRARRTKTDWSGLTIGDAFKNNLDYYSRLEAQRSFYRMARRVQAAAAQAALDSADIHFEPKTKPQLGPCYTDYPAAIAAYAAIGLTGFLEYKTLARGQALMARLAEYLKNPAEADHITVNPKIYQKVVELTAASVQHRLLLEDLARVKSLSTVEIYRLFLASQQTMRFETLKEVVDGVILFGDVLPPASNLRVHPMTAAIMQDLVATSASYFEMLPRLPSSHLLALGTQWVKALCKMLAKYLPPLDAAPKPRDNRPGLRRPRTLEEAADYQFPPEPPQPSKDDSFAPLDDPTPPTLFPPASLAQRIMQSLLGQDEDGPSADLPEDAKPPNLDEETQAILGEFGNALNKAAEQKADWEDIRADLLERQLRQSDFSEGPIQGAPTDGHEVEVAFSGGDVVGGEIFDRPVELSNDLLAHDKLLRQAALVTEKLRRTLYPNIEQVPETERFRTGGTLDPARLAQMSYSPVVFKRYRVHEKADRRGRPVLLIACDGSGSLNPRQMQMTKVLAAAWLRSTIKSQVEVLAGLYHSGTVRGALSGPLVQWMYHPHKTPTTNRVEATRALVTLPDNGTGVQSDALSIAFMLEEAKRLARGRMIYLILITDCEWNVSFNKGKKGREEVRALFESVYAQAEGKLHTTMVALGVKKETSFEDLLDKVIVVPEEKLTDCAAVAEQIGVYVASCMKERVRLVARRPKRGGGHGQIEK